MKTRLRYIVQQKLNQINKKQMYDEIDKYNKGLIKSLSTISKNIISIANGVNSQDNIRVINDYLVNKIDYDNKIILDKDDIYKDIKDILENNIQQNPNEVYDGQMKRLEQMIRKQVRQYLVKQNKINLQQMIRKQVRQYLVKQNKGKQLYSKVSVFLTKNTAKDTAQAMKKYKSELNRIVGNENQNLLYTLVDIYYNIDDYTSDEQNIDDFLNTLN